MSKKRSWVQHKSINVAKNNAALCACVRVAVKRACFLLALFMGLEKKIETASDRWVGVVDGGAARLDSVASFESCARHDTAHCPSSCLFPHNPTTALYSPLAFLASHSSSPPHPPAQPHPQPTATTHVCRVCSFLCARHSTRQSQQAGTGTMVVPKLLPYDVHEPPKGFDSFTAKVHEFIPLSAQRAFRDRHAHWFDRAVSVSAIALAARHPKALLRFLALRRTAQVFQYGHESSQQVVELHRCGKQDAPVVVFMHGGAWFSGRPWMYRLIATALNRQGLDVGIVGYGTYKTLPPVPGTPMPPPLEGTGDFSVVLGHVVRTSLILPTFCFSSSFLLNLSFSHSLFSCTKYHVFHFLPISFPTLPTFLPPSFSPRSLIHLLPPSFILTGPSNRRPAALPRIPHVRPPQPLQRQRHPHLPLGAFLRRARLQPLAPAPSPGSAWL